LKLNFQDFISKFNQKSKNRIKKGDQIKESYKFWDTQPVPKITSEDQKVNKEIKVR